MRYHRRVMVMDIEKKMFAIAYQICPFLKRTKVSKLKVEKVLNPPVKPIIKKKYQKFLPEKRGSNLPKANPSTKQASKLAKKVPMGKSCLK